MKADYENAESVTDEDDRLGDGDSEPEGADNDSIEPRRASGRRRWLPAAVVAVATIVAIAAIAWGATRSNRSGDDNTDGARRAATTFGAAYLTFDSSSVDQASDQLLALMTDNFAAEFRTSRLPTVSQLFSGKSTSTRATVTDTFVSSLADGRVRVLVVVDVDATAPQGTQRVVNLSFLVDLVNHGGWRVDGVDPLPVPKVLSPSSTDSTSSASTPSTTPTVPTDTTPDSAPPTTTPGG